MRGARLLVASHVLAICGAGMAFAQAVNPLRVLVESRRDRLELDKRIARDQAAQRQKEQAAQAAHANAQRKLDEERAASASSSLLGGVPPSQLEASTGPEIIPGARISAAPAASGLSETPALNLPVGSAREQSALAPGSPTDRDNGSIPSGPAAARQSVSGVVLPTAPASSALIETPAADQAAASSAYEGKVGTPASTPTRVLIAIDKAAQRMRVMVDGKLRHSWAVSTGRAHFETPTGTFRALHLAKVHYSREWDDAPMPHSIFFTGRGHAIHGSNATRSLGRRASHGCVRLAPAQAAALFALVQAEGVAATKVTITSRAPRG
jgi:lipoprotein-anchoring transpeptidase ErfK/SrfK